MKALRAIEKLDLRIRRRSRNRFFRNEALEALAARLDVADHYLRKDNENLLSWHVGAAMAAAFVVKFSSTEPSLLLLSPFIVWTIAYVTIRRQRFSDARARLAKLSDHVRDSIDRKAPETHP